MKRQVNRLGENIYRRQINKDCYPKYTNNTWISTIRKQAIQFKNGKKTWTDTSSKKIYRWEISIWKDAPNHMSSGKCKLSQQWDATTYQLEWPKSKYWQHQMPVRMWSNRNFHSLLVGMQNGAATLEDNLMVSYKTKHTVTTWSSSHAP